MVDGSDRAAPIAVIVINFDRDTTNGIKGLRYILEVRSRHVMHIWRWTLGHITPSQSLTVNGRVYRFLQRPLVVVCLDGSSIDYIRAACERGVAPYLSSLVSRGNLRMAEAVMPTFTNSNNLSIVTGVPPSYHGISGNSFLDRTSGQAVMMNDAALLRAETIPAAFSQAGAKVVVITAKEKLRKLLGYGLDGVCFSAEEKGQPVYSSMLSEYVLQRGVELMQSERPDLMYLSTSDYIQHLYPPGSTEANQFYAAIDRELAQMDRAGATLVITADHGMNSKADKDGRPRAIFLQTLLDEWFGTDTTRVILPITDPYVAHHGSLGSFASIYLTENADRAQIVQRLSPVSGVELVLEQRVACRLFELPPDRIGDIVVCADRHTVLGARSDEYDLSAMTHWLRSHGGLAERVVPILFSRPISRKRPVWKLRNYDAFWLGLNAIRDD
jgi:phosphonoacetate hydrolase